MSVEVKYRTSATANGGRDGHARTEDGTLDLVFVTPRELGEAGSKRTNPEDVQLLVESAHQTCPYSNATRGDIDVPLTVP